MKKGGKGGGNTITGLHFERKADLAFLLKKMPGYDLVEVPGEAGKRVLFKGKLVARVFKKHGFYKYLEEKQIDWTEVLSKQLLPDEAMLVGNTLFIIEDKYQQVNGSVDEKLQTCDFKRKQYQKLVRPLGLKVEYVYVLNDWFNNSKYRDVLQYIEDMGCHYKFNELPLFWLDLPVP